MTEVRAGQVWKSKGTGLEWQASRVDRAGYWWLRNKAGTVKPVTKEALLTTYELVRDVQ